MTQPSVAILGASTDRGKFGNKSVRAHLSKGYTVYPVNPKGEVIEGLNRPYHVAVDPVKAKAAAQGLWIEPTANHTRAWHRSWSEEAGFLAPSYELGPRTELDLSASLAKYRTLAAEFRA